MRSRFLTRSLALAALVMAVAVGRLSSADPKSQEKTEEEFIRTAYAKLSYADEVRSVLDALLHTGRDRLWSSKANAVDRALDSRLSFALSDFEFGKISAIADRKIGDFDGSSSWIGGEVLDVTPSIYNYSANGAPSTYVAYIKYAWKPSPFQSLSPAESWPVGKVLQAEQFEGRSYTDYVTYTVTLTFGDKSRTYETWVLFGRDETGKMLSYFMDAVADPTGVTFGAEHSLYPQAFVETDLRTVPFVDKWLHDNARSCSAPHSEKDNNRIDVCCDPQTGRCGVALTSLAARNLAVWSNAPRRRVSQKREQSHFQHWNLLMVM